MRYRVLQIGWEAYWPCLGGVRGRPAGWRTMTYGFHKAESAGTLLHSLLLPTWWLTPTLLMADPRVGQNHSYIEWGIQFFRQFLIRYTIICGVYVYIYITLYIRFWPTLLIQHTSTRPEGPAKKDGSERLVAVPHNARWRSLRCRCGLRTWHKLGPSPVKPYVLWDGRSFSFLNKSLLISDFPCRQLSTDWHSQSLPIPI